MRTRTSSSTLTASACALLLALTVTACGDDEGELMPMAKDSEAIALFLEKNVGCQDTDYYVGDDLLEFRAQVSYAIDGAGDCDVSDDIDIDFMHVTNMSGFQKDLADSGSADDTGLMVGMNFVVDADNDENAKALLDAGLLYIACEPGVNIPDTYRQVEADAGCVLTDYAREEDEDY